MLRAFITRYREEILARARSRVAQRTAPVATMAELTNGLPMFFDQLSEALRKASSGEELDHSEISTSAGRHGSDLFRQGLTVAQVVHDYGDLCQVITALAVEQQADIGASDFQTLNLCLDDAIAGAVTEHARLREEAISNEGTERLGILAHEMRNLLNTALMSFASIKRGVVAPGGSTSSIHERSLLRLHSLIDSSLADVRLDAGMQNLERLRVKDVIDEVVIGAAMVAETRGLTFAVADVDDTAYVEADRQILSAAITNLLQNAFKFTRKSSTVHLRATTQTHVLIAVEDACGGLPPGKTETLLRPFTQEGADRTGLGLGLSICLKAVTSIGGALRIEDLPGKGCIFTIELPKQAPPPSKLRENPPNLKVIPGGDGGAAAHAHAHEASYRSLRALISR
jgi:signal transduction histidine kinase